MNEEEIFSNFAGASGKLPRSESNFIRQGRGEDRTITGRLKGLSKNLISAGLHIHSECDEGSIEPPKFYDSNEIVMWSAGYLYDLAVWDGRAKLAVRSLFDGVKIFPQTEAPAGPHQTSL